MYSLHAISYTQVNTPSGSNNDIPLTSACWKGHCCVVQLLLEYHSDIEHHTKDGCTPLMLAARSVCLSVCPLFNVYLHKYVLYVLYLCMLCVYVCVRII